MLLGSLVLAGGRSRRMGKPKESLPFGDSTLLGHTADTLLSCTWPVLVVARDPGQDLPPLALEADVVTDEEPGAGPLAAMATGFRTVGSECDALLVCGCDMPWLDAAAVSWLADRLGDHDLVMPRLDDRLQPLCAIYRTSLLATIDELRREDVATPRTLADRADALLLGPDALAEAPGTGRFVRSVNTPEEYEAARRE